MSQLNLGDAVPLVSLQRKETALGNTQKQSDKINVHEWTQTQGSDRVRQEVLGKEEVCTSSSWLTVTVSALLGFDVFLSCWFWGHTLWVSAPMAPRQSSTFPSPFVLWLPHNITPPFLWEHSGQNLLLGGHHKAQDPRISSGKNVPQLRSWLPSNEDAAVLKQMTGSVVTFKTGASWTLWGWSSLQLNYWHFAKYMCGWSKIALCWTLPGHGS